MDIYPFFKVYHPSTGEFIFTDKYKGRKFGESDFKACMKDFFYNGSRYRTDLLEPLIEKLQNLLRLLHKIDCYRFYCSSLLVMYDGHEAASTTSKVEVRMIDFAQSRIKSEETNYHIGPDQGYILGVKSLVDIFTEINQSIRN